MKLQNIYTGEVIDVLPLPQPFTKFGFEWTHATVNAQGMVLRYFSAGSGLWKIIQ